MTTPFQLSLSDMTSFAIRAAIVASPATPAALAVVHALPVDPGQAGRLHRARLVSQRLRRLHAQPDALHLGGRADPLDGAVLGVRALVGERGHLGREEARDADAHDAADERQETREKHLREGRERRGGPDCGLRDGRRIFRLGLPGFLTCVTESASIALGAIALRA